MGWHSFTKSIGRGFKGVSDWIGGNVGNSPLGNWLGDFKDWFDGTDAMQHQAQIQDQYNMKYWNLQNAYNTPAMQMARFKEAGLNPNLIYGQTNTASEIGSNNVRPPESGSGVISKAAQTIASIYGLKSMAATISNLKAQNSNIHSQNTLLSSQSDYVNEQARKLRLENNYFQNTGRLARPEGSLGAAVGDFVRYMDWLTPDINRGGSQTPSIKDESMFKMLYNSMRRNYERRFNNRSNGRRESDVKFIKSRW